MTNRLFAAFLFSMTLWGLLIFSMRYTTDLEQALWRERIAVVFITSTPVFYYHFANRYSDAKIRSFWVPTVYLYLIASVILAPTSLIVEGMEVDPYGNAPVWGPLFVVWIIPIYLSGMVALYHLNRARNLSISYEERNRLLYFIIGGATILGGAAFDLLPILGIDIYPGTIIANIFFALLTSIAILRYHLFDIQVATHRITPYFLMTALVVGPYLAIHFALYHFWGDERAPLWLHLFFVVVLIVGITHLWKKVQEWTNWLFYRGRYEHLKALERIQEEAQSIIDPNSINTFFPNVIRQAMQASHLYLLLPSHSTGDFEIAATAGLHDEDVAYSLSKDSPILKWLQLHTDLLRREDVGSLPQFHALTMLEKQTLQEMGGALYVPLKSSSRLIGVMIMGPKANDEPYSWEDERLIKRVTGQMALNIENIQLYQASLERESQLATLSSLNKAISSSMDIQSTYGLFADELKKVIPLDWASVAFIEEDEMRFFARSTEIVTEWGEPGTAIPLEGTATEWMANNKKPFIENDLSQSIRFPSGEAHLKNGLHSLVYLPLFSQEGVMGSFVVGSSRPHAYGIRESSFLEQVASQLSLTMENVRLYARERGGRTRLEILNEQREEFFRAISHELKTPLTAIKSSSELLSEELSDEKQAPHRRLIDNVRRSADRLEIMLNDLMDMAKARAVPLEMHFQRLDVPTAVRNAIDLCSPPINQRHQKLIVNVPRDIPQIVADAKWFEYIITNLLSNANKYSPEWGRITLSAWVDAAKLYISVQDTGPGIPDEEQDLIFEPFYRGKFCVERVKGIGVGLATVKQIVRLHGGKVGVISENGSGSTFIVSIPLP